MPFTQFSKDSAGISNRVFGVGRMSHTTRGSGDESEAELIGYLTFYDERKGQNSQGMVFPCYGGDPLSGILLN